MNARDQTNSLRGVALVATARKASPAPGLIVDRPLPGPEVDYVSPFLMIDHFGPETVRPGGGGGLNPHPHRGFETVTFLFEGAMEHQDSLGNKGLLRPGGVQWMTAAQGIVHAEYHEKQFAQRGGTLHGIQLWVNLPARHKMAQPGYQDLSADRIPVVTKDGATVRVIAGEALGARGPAKTFTPITALHVRLEPGARIEVPAPAGFNALAYVFRGGATVSDVELRERQMAVLDNSGDTVAVAADGLAELLVLSGEPIDEPVVSWGPFVMNTQAEILQARQDYGSGRMGRLAGVPF
jgi:redox-sensitive bicupin YhaK (pirin superfamily)